MINVDGRDGSSLARLYDVMAYPAILVTRDGGELVASWQGTDLPLMDELAAYANLQLQFSKKSIQQQYE